MQAEVEGSIPSGSNVDEVFYRSFSCACADRFEASLRKAVEHFEDQVVGVVSGVVTTALLESVKVSYYGSLTPIRHLANTSVRDGRILVVPHDPSLLKPVQQALSAGGFAAHVFSATTVCVNTAPPGVDERDKVVKHVRKLGEEAKVAIRNLRRREKATLDNLPEDDKVVAIRRVDRVIEAYVARVDKAVTDRVNHLLRR